MVCEGGRVVGAVGALLCPGLPPENPNDAAVGALLRRGAPHTAAWDDASANDGGATTEEAAAMELVHMYVRPSRRRRGYGRALKRAVFRGSSLLAAPMNASLGLTRAVADRQKSSSSGCVSWVKPPPPMAIIFILLRPTYPVSACISQQTVFVCGLSKANTELMGVISESKVDQKNIIYRNTDLRLSQDSSGEEHFLEAAR